MMFWRRHWAAAVTVVVTVCLFTVVRMIGG